MFGVIGLYILLTKPINVFETNLVFICKVLNVLILENQNTSNSDQKLIENTTIHVLHMSWYNKTQGNRSTLSTPNNHHQLNTIDMIDSNFEILPTVNFARQCWMLMDTFLFILHVCFC